VACCRWCGIGLGWSGALAGPPRDQLTGDEPMDQDYPDPPPELVQQWWEEADQHVDCDDPETYFDYVAIQAARWDADQKRRPKLPSLKEQALALLEPQGSPARLLNEDQMGILRRALEQLPDQATSENVLDHG
jgi:hypothetical protein